MKKLFSVLLALLMMSLSTVSHLCAEDRYTDIKADAWYTDSVEFVIKKGYMVGMSEGIFSPNTALTREQFVVILANISEVDTNEYKDEALMSDVKPAHWFAGAVNWAVKEGYVAGVSRGVFGVGQPIQRAALARLIYLYAEKNGKVTDSLDDLSKYTDHDKVQSWMRDGLGWAVKQGIITSSKEDSLTLDPRGTVTRAQCARMLTVYDSVENSDPLCVDKEALKEFLKSAGTRRGDSLYIFNTLSLTFVYDGENELLYAEYFNTDYPPYYFSYEFGSDEVYIYGPGRFMPPIEYGDDLSLIKPYMKFISKGDMTSAGIINAPDKYTQELDMMFQELTDMLKAIGASK